MSTRTLAAVIGLGAVLALALYALRDGGSASGRFETAQDASLAPETASTSTPVPFEATREPASTSASPPPTDARVQELLVSGRITDREGRALAGARVLVAVPRHPGKQPWRLQPLELGLGGPPEVEGGLTQAESGLDGAFQLGVPRAEELHVALRHAGLVGLDLVFAVPEENSELDLGALALDPGAELRGRVRDGSGRPIAGARIVRMGKTSLASEHELEWSGLALATSAADGTFVLDGLALGRTSLEVRAPGFVPERRDLFADALELPQWTVELLRAAPITGRIVGGPSGAALQVYYWRSNTKEQVHVACEGDGSFVLDGLPPELGELRLQAVRRAHDDFGPFASVVISAGVPAHPGDRDVEILVPAPVTYRVEVVDATTREPLTAANMALLGTWGIPDERATAPEQGPPGIYAISALLPETEGSALSLTHPGYDGLAIGELPFGPGETHDLGTVALIPLEATRVRVLSSAGEPLSGANVRALPDDGEEWHDVPVEWSARSRLPVRTEATTTADGSTLVHFSNEQAYVLTIEHEGHAPLEELIEVGAHPPQEIELRLPCGGTVTIQCRDARTEEPLAHVQVQHKLARLPEKWRYQPEFSTDANGRARLEHVPPGAHHFWLEDEYGSGAQLVDVVDGAELQIVLRQASAERVRLHGIVRERGLPLAGALIEVWGHETATDLGGAYGFAELELDHDESGETELIVTHPRHGSVHLQTLELVSPVTRVDIELELCVLGGVVRDAQGEALAGAVLWLALRGPDGRFAALYGADGEAMHLASSATDGSFGFPAVQSRPDLFLVAQREGFLARRVGPLAFVPDGSPLRLEIALERAARLEVEVQESESVLAALGAQLFAIWLGTEPLPVDDREQEGAPLPGASGAGLRRFRFDSLQPGPWSIEMRDLFDFGNGPPLAHGEVRLEPGDNPRIRLSPR